MKQQIYSSHKMRETDQNKTKFSFSPHYICFIKITGELSVRMNLSGYAQNSDSHTRSRRHDVNPEEDQAG